MASIKFYINKAQAKWTEEETLYARFTHNSGNIKIFPKEAIKLNPSHWNSKAQKLEGKSTATMQTNSRILKETLRITEAWEQYAQATEMSGYTPTLPGFQEHLRGADKGKATVLVRAQTLPELMQLYLQTGGTNNTPGTKKQYNSAISIVSKFGEDTGHPLTIENLTMEFFTSFASWLTSRGIKNQTVNIYVGKVARTLRYLSRKGSEHIRKRIPMDFINVEPMPTGAKGERDHITEEEAHFLNTLHNMPSGLRAVRDLYLLVCYTGPRFTDAVNLHHDTNIISVPTENGEMKMLTYSQRKVKEAAPVQVPLNAICESIIQRNLSMTGRLIPTMNNVTANRRMRTMFRKLKAFYKEVSANEARFLKGRQFKSQDATDGAKYCGFTDPKTADVEKLRQTLDTIKGLLKTREKVDYCGGERQVVRYERWEKLTMHTSRHSFGTMLDAKGLDMEDIRQMMGHSDIKTTAIYRHRNKMKVFNRVSEVLNRPIMKVG